MEDDELDMTYLIENKQNLQSLTVGVGCFDGFVEGDTEGFFVGCSTD